MGDKESIPSDRGKDPVAAFLRNSRVTPEQAQTWLATIDLTLPETGPTVSAQTGEKDKGTDQQRFERRQQEVQPEMDRFNDNYRDKKYGDPYKLTTALKQPVSDVLAARRNLKKETEKPEPDYAAAYGELDKAADAIQRCDAAYVIDNGQAKLAYESEKSKHQAQIDKIQKKIGDSDYGGPPPIDFQMAINGFTSAKTLMDDGERQGNYLLAQQGLRDIPSTFPQFQKAQDALKERWAKSKKAAEDLTAAIQNNVYPGLNAEKIAYAQAVKTANADAPKAQKEEKFGALGTAIDQLDLATKAFQKLSLDKDAAEFLALNKAGKNTKSKKEVIASFEALKKKHPDFLKTLTETPQARKEFDKVIIGLGKDAGSSKDFFKEVIKERFGLEKLEGDLSSDCLPRLYELFSKVPDSHARQAKLKTVKRYKNKGIESFYSAPDDDKEGGEVVLKGVRVSGPGSWAFDLVKEQVFVRHGNLNALPKGEKPPTAFDWTTLHEIGHAVDENMTFMKRNQNKPAFGGWKDETPESIASEAAAQKNFFGTFKDRTVYPANFLKKYLINILTNQKGFVDIAQDITKLQLTEDKLKSDPPFTDYEKEVRKLETDYQKKAGQLSGEKDEAKKEKDTKKLDREKTKAMKKAADDAAKKTKLAGKASELVRKVLDRLVEGERKDDAVKAVWSTFDLEIPKNTTPDWKALEKHDAAAWCRTVRDSMGSGMIFKGEAKYQLPDKRVYQQGYPGQWSSYDSAAQSLGLTNYQFRAPGEWFAECYAAYYVRTAPRMLPATHPLFKTLDDDKLGPES